MAYTINKTDGTELTVLQDATVDTTTSITLVGRNYIGYGEIQNENFLFLLENFANDAAPSTPIAGQIWFDTTTRTLKVYDADKWVSVGAAELSETPPSEPPQGAFWLKTPINTLYVYDGNDWKLIGPEAVDGFGTTRAVSTSVLADTGTRYPIIEVYVNDVVTGIISSNSFTLSTVNPIQGFTDIKAGYNLPTGFVYQGNLTGVADKATRLETLRLINGVGFDGSKDITIKASTTNELLAGDYISGTNFDGSSSKTWAVDASPNNLIGRVVARDGAGDFAAGTITANLIGNVQGNVTVATGNSTFNTVTANQFIGAQLTGNADTATRFSTPRNINGVAFDGTTDVTVPADSNTLTGTNLANNVKTSALTSVGILSSLSVAGSIVLDNNLTIEGNGDAEISSLRKLLITVNDNADDAALQLISPDTAVGLGIGPRGGLTPVTDGDVDLGKSTHKFDNVHANTFNGSLVGNATSSTTSGTANNLAGGSAGSIPYQTASGATNFVPAGTAGYVLRSQGAGAPVWGNITFSTLNVGNYLSGDNYDGVSPATLNVDATATNTSDKIVARDSNGDFAAGTITANLQGLASRATNSEMIDVTDNSSSSTKYFELSYGVSPRSALTNSDFTGYIQILSDPGSTQSFPNRTIVKQDGTDVATSTSVRDSIAVGSSTYTKNTTETRSGKGALYKERLLGNTAFTNNTDFLNNFLAGTLTAWLEISPAWNEGGPLQGKQTAVLENGGINKGILQSSSSTLGLYETIKDTSINTTYQKDGFVLPDRYVEYTTGSSTENVNRSYSSTADLVTYWQDSAAGNPVTPSNGWFVCDPPINAPEFLGTGFYGQDIFIDKDDNTVYNGTNESDTSITVGSKTYNRTGSPITGAIAFTVPSGTYVHNVAIYNYDIVEGGTTYELRGWRFNKIDGDEFDAILTSYDKTTSASGTSGYVTFADANTGYANLNTDESLQYDASTGILSTTAEFAQKSTTQPASTNNTTIATTEFVQAALSNFSTNGIDTITYGNTVYSTSGYTNQVGSFNNSRNYFDVFPPSGKSMGNLVAFIPSIAVVHYAGGVDGNDSIRCTWQAQSDRIRVWVQNTEQRSTPAANYLAVWS